MKLSTKKMDFKSINENDLFEEDTLFLLDDDEILVHDSFDHFIDDPMHEDKHTSFTLEDY